jgi:hypothetical protein
MLILEAMWPRGARGKSKPDYRAPRLTARSESCGG